MFRILSGTQSVLNKCVLLLFLLLLFFESKSKNLGPTYKTASVRELQSDILKHSENRLEHDILNTMFIKTYLNQ